MINPYLEIGSESAGLMESVVRLAGEKRKAAILVATRSSRDARLWIVALSTLGRSVTVNWTEHIVHILGATVTVRVVANADDGLRNMGVEYDYLVDDDANISGLRRIMPYVGRRPL